MSTYSVSVIYDDVKSSVVYLSEKVLWMRGMAALMLVLNQLMSNDGYNLALPLSSLIRAAVDV